MLSSSQSEKEAKSSNYLRTLEREREHLKQKCNEVEAKLKENESRRNLIHFEVEKERAKWTIERDQLNNRASELNETIESLERQKESLFKECEKYKSQARKNNLLVKTPSTLTGMKSPQRYGQGPNTPSHNFEPNAKLSKSTFFAPTMKITGNQSRDSDTSSQRSLELNVITAPIQRKSFVENKTNEAVA